MKLDAINCFHPGADAHRLAVNRTLITYRFDASVNTIGSLKNGAAA